MLAGDDGGLHKKAALRFFRALKKAQSVFTMFRPIRAITFRPKPTVNTPHQNQK
jgi:hypothetical protein